MTHKIGTNPAHAERCGTQAPAMARSPVVLVPIFGAHATVFGFDPACNRIDLRNTISALDLEFDDAPAGCTISVKFGADAHQTLTLAGVARDQVNAATFLNMAQPSRTSVVRQQVPRWSPPFPVCAPTPASATA